MTNPTDMTITKNVEALTPTLIRADVTLYDPKGPDTKILPGAVTGATVEEVKAAAAKIAQDGAMYFHDPSRTDPFSFEVTPATSAPPAPVQAPELARDLFPTARSIAFGSEFDCEELGMQGSHVTVRFRDGWHVMVAVIGPESAQAAQVYEGGDLCIQGRPQEMRWLLENDPHLRPYLTA